MLSLLLSEPAQRPSSCWDWAVTALRMCGCDPHAPDWLSWCTAPVNCSPGGSFNNHLSHFSSTKYTLTYPTQNLHNSPVTNGIRPPPLRRRKVRPGRVTCSNRTATIEGAHLASDSCSLSSRHPPPGPSHRKALVASSPTLQRAPLPRPGSKAKVREAGGGGGAALLVPVPGRASSRPCSLPGPRGAAWWGEMGRREGGGGRQEALLELLRGNFVGKGDKEDIKRSPRVCGEEPRGLNSLPAGRGDEKADS